MVEGSNASMTHEKLFHRTRLCIHENVRLNIRGENFWQLGNYFFQVDIAIVNHKIAVLLSP